jgi:hypothetical protein
MISTYNFTEYHIEKSAIQTRTECANKSSVFQTGWIEQNKTSVLQVYISKGLVYICYNSGYNKYWVGEGERYTPPFKQSSQTRGRRRHCRGVLLPLPCPMFVFRTYRSHTSWNYMVMPGPYLAARN